MDTYCARSWNYFLVDLDNMDHKMCCKTKWRPMDPGKDWFNGPAMVERRQYHLSGKQHSDCEHCWDLENQSQWSPRIGIARPDPITDSLSSYDKGMLEILLGNTCDMACRYCDARYSSIWAARKNDQVNSKAYRSNLRSNDRSKLVLQQFYDWLEIEKHKLADILFTGGEPLLMDNMYDILDKFNFKNLNLQVNTNLNTPEHYLKKLEATLDRLLDNGNSVSFRVSVDGIGQQNDWQRQGSNWDRLRDNWYRIGSRPVYMKAAFTVTPLTLEGMPDIANFVLNSRAQLAHEPVFEIPNVLTWPRPLNVVEWFGSFKNEISQFTALLDKQRDYGQKTKIKHQCEEWLALPSDPPSYEQVQSFANFCDQSQAQWGGGDWRSIYPKTAAIAQRVLDQGTS